MQIFKQKNKLYFAQIVIHFVARRMKTKHYWKQLVYAFARNEMIYIIHCGIYPI